MIAAVQGLYAIVDVPPRRPGEGPGGLSVEEAVRAVLGDRLEGGRDGAAVVQLRAKHASTEQRVRWLEPLVRLCRAAGAVSIVNDDLDAAIASGADGVHLGQQDDGADDVAGVRARAAERGCSTLKVGLSTHDLGQLRAAGRQAPDYVALGPITPTRSKANPEPTVGWHGLLDGCRVASRPLVAIGGLGLETGCRAIEAGATAVAVIAALFGEGPFGGGPRGGESQAPGAEPKDEAERVRGRAIGLARAFREAATPLELDEVHRRIPVLPREQLAELARWGDALGVHIALGLPARFGPRVEQGRPLYRPCDVIDLIEALGKRPDESWDAWRLRSVDDPGPLVQLRRAVP